MSTYSKKISCPYCGIQVFYPSFCKLDEVMNKCERCGRYYKILDDEAHSVEEPFNPSKR